MIATIATRLKKGTASGQNLSIVTLSRSSDRRAGTGRRYCGVEDPDFGIKTTDMVRFLNFSLESD